MHINKAVFKNFGRHAHLALEFSKGLVGIVGPNGSGKSTVTDGIYAALTGDFARFDGVKTDNINDTAESGEASYIELEGEHDGTSFVLRRSLRPSHSRLTVGGEEELTKSGDIQRALEESLGIDNKLIDAYVFVAQWRMFEFMSQTSGKRAEAFQHLCNTGKAAVIHSLVGKELDAVGSIGDIVDNGDDIRVRMSKREKDLVKARKSRDSVKDKRLTKEKRRKADDFLARHDRCLRLTTMISDLTIQRDEHAATMDSALLVSEGKEKLLEELRTLVNELRPQANEARVAISQLEQNRRTAASKQKYEEELARLAEVAKSWPKPPKPENLSSLETMKSERTRATHCGAQARSIVDRFNEDGVTECPTCGMPTDNMGNHLEAQETTATEFEYQCAELTEKIGKLEAAKKAWDDWVWKKRNHDRDVKAAEDVLKELSVVEAPEGTLGDFKAAISDHEEQVENLDTVEHAYNKAVNSFDTTKALHGDIVRRLGLYYTEHNEKAIKESTANNARKALAKDVERGEQLAALDERVRLLEEENTADEEAIESLEFQLSKHTKKLRYKRMLEGIRAVTHAKFLPQVVAQRNLEDMEADINDELSMFGDPFWVEAGGDLTFDVHFPGAPARAAARLSGGQKVVLAVAFRTVVSSLFGDELGMLVLDEPAAGLDERNIGFLSDALTQFAAEVRGRRQIIVITHADALKPAFDQCIELE